jgi:methionine biosynthesis protein MetW
MASNHEDLKPDYRIILDWVDQGSSVLDLGCGEGDLLYQLVKQKGVRGQGVEIDEKAIYKCVAKGLNVFHDDIEGGLTDYQDEAFDYAILDQTFQQIHYVDRALDSALRVGKRVIVGFPNFAYYKSRFQIFFRGRTPVTQALPYMWYETPNLHSLSIRDFEYYCAAKKIVVECSAYLSGSREVKFFPNFFAQIGLFQIRKAIDDRGAGI